MKINKGILTGMTALSLFATSAAAATSAVTPVISNAAAKKTEVKRSVKYVFLEKVVSKGHATKYFKIVAKSPKMTNDKLQLGWGVSIASQKGYSVKNKRLDFGTMPNGRVVASFASYATFTNIKHKAIKDSQFVGDGAVRISKAEFNKIVKQQKL
ncbi:hypothetical protein [Apilactobacillus apinorum]|uniref:hypothetical protein n=1 Tax=Apilactobacillus apinorum TaxID=1218495 RepID=UPI0006B62C27|nr:hypothetical protein [Apilactobacillus apinorum]KOY68473.1 hypothetical protein RZ74_10250 [Apilactobacillus apinorum]CAI2686614.1 Hypothetical protein AAPFHON13_11150 [Apilactobacillus apinorum]